MSIEVKDKIGSATVSVHWNVTTEEPEISVDVQIDSTIFPVKDCLAALANGARRMGDELDKQVAKQGTNPPITDDEY